jgi:thioredoxin 1
MDKVVFDSIIKNNKVVLVDFWANWCPHCISIMPQVDLLKTKMSGRAEVIKINSDEAHDLAQHFSIRSLPTFLFIKNGEEVSRISGGSSFLELETKLNSLI